MNKLTLLSLAAVSAGLSAYSQTQTGLTKDVLEGSETSFRATEVGPHSRVWKKTVYVPTPSGEKRPMVHSYVELATGMHYYDEASKQWKEAKEEFEILPGMAVARKGQHKVVLRDTPRLTGAVELQTPDGQTIKSHVLGLSYYDYSTGDSALIGEVADCEGKVYGNKVIYANAFSQVKADLVYEYTRGGFEQNVVLRSQLPDPEDCGLNPASTTLQVLTEIDAFESVKVKAGQVSSEKGVELPDETLRFGAMEIGNGRAFRMDRNGKDTPVAKQFLKMEGRDFLIEEVFFTDVKDEIKTLPAMIEGASIHSGDKPVRRVASRRRELPMVKVASSRVQNEIQIAEAAPSDQGFVLDYSTINTTLTNYVFQGDTTYYVTGPVNLYDTNVMEGGTVIKYAKDVSAQIKSFGYLDFQTGPYRPAVMTAKDDNSVGETISGSTGNPSGEYAYAAIYLNMPTASHDLHDLRISHAKWGVFLVGLAGCPKHQVRDCQFYNNTYAVRTALAATATLWNDLFFKSSDSAIYAGSSGVQGEHLTIDQANKAVYTGVVALTNSLLVSVTNWPTAFTSVNNITNNDSGTFQAVGGGLHYLAAESPYRNVGTTNINPLLLAALAKKTTYPPAFAYTNVTFTNETRFSQQVQRDTDAPDLGYHYDPLDYTFGGCWTRTNLTFSPGTAAGWFRTSSGWYHAGQAIRMIGDVVVSFEGTAVKPVYWVRLNTVQELDRTAGYGHGSIENWEEPAVPTVRGRFLRCTAMAGEVFNGYFADDYGLIRAEMTHSDFWCGALVNYGDYMRYTNCLMWRLGLGIVNGATGRDHVLRNCTMIGGTLLMSRQSWYGPSPVSIRDCSFDGTTISVNDYYGSNPTYTDYDYNACSSATNPFPAAVSGLGIQTNVVFNWQKSWLGAFYLPTNSSLINTGSVASASLAGLYHFTTQTNQAKEANSALDIGYHYVAVGSSGFPVDLDSDFVPDHIEDANGNGIYDDCDPWDWQTPDADTDGDSLPDWWEYYWFGNLFHTGAEQDANGFTLLEEYQFYASATVTNDPNSIVFSISASNDYVNAVLVSMQLDISVGDPSQYAVIFNSTGSTNWLPFNGTNLTANLGPSDGYYPIWVGLKGPAAQATQSWQQYGFTLDRVPPQLTITNPILSDGMANVCKPYLQLLGFADEPLASLTYDITNAGGLIINECAFLIDRAFDTNTFDFTTNYFQAYDVALATNDNWITLQVADRAGNIVTTNFNIVLDYSTATNPPGLQLIWPQDGMAVSGSSITIRGKMSDETGTIIATVINGDGVTNVIDGLVERNHTFWIEDLPLNGTNQIMIQATDAAGNTATTNLTVIPSDLVLTIDATPEGADLYSGPGAVRGTVGNAAAIVTVNGVTAAVETESNANGTYDWTAEDVPVIGPGTASFTANADPGGGASTTSANLDKEFEAKLEMFTYNLHIYHNVASYGIDPYPYGYDWRKGVTNTFFQTNGVLEKVIQGRADELFWDDNDSLPLLETMSETHYEWNGKTELETSIGYLDGEQISSYYSDDFDDLIKSAPEDSVWGKEYFADGKACNWFIWPQGVGGLQEHMVDAKTELKLYTGGKAIVGRKNLFCIQCGGTEYFGPPWAPSSKGIPANELTTAWGTVGSDGKRWVALPDNEAPLVSLTAPGKKHYYADATPEKYHPHILANGTDLDTNTPEFCVGQKVTFVLAGLPPGQIQNIVGRWKLPQKYVNESWQHEELVTADPPTYSVVGSVNYRINDNLLANSDQTSCWFVRGTGGTVGIGMNALLSNGQCVSVAAKGEFGLLVPFVTRIVPYPPFGGTIDSSYGQLRLLGNPMHYDAYISETYPGSFGITQLIQLHYWTMLPGFMVPIWYSSGGQFALDSSEWDEWYDPLIEVNLAPGSYPSGFEYYLPFSLYDAPGYQGLFAGVSCDVSCRDYIRFIPDGSESIPVTLGRVDWTWNSVAEQDILLQWHITGDAVTGPELCDDDAFPMWTSTISGHNYED